jgi:hypothetical protein
MGINKNDRNRRAATHKLTFQSFWRILGFNVPSYAQWLISPAANDFGMCPISVTQCDLCGTDGPEVKCIMQGGEWRCTVKQNMQTEIHRDVNTPIDVGSMKLFAGNVKARNARVALARPDAMVIEELKQDDVEDFPLMNRLLRFLGFAQGLATAEGVTPEQLISATTTTVPLSREDRLRTEIALGVTLPDTWHDMNSIVQMLRKILKRASRALVVKRSRKGLRAIVDMQITSP